VQFALDGRSLEIDSFAANASKLRAVIQRYINASRRTGRDNRSTRPSLGSRGRGREEAQAVRGWARASGYSVSDRGRINAEILDANDQAPIARGPARFLAVRTRRCDAGSSRHSTSR
jgi:hypothetical protein